MTDISLIEVLQKHGWKTHKTTTLKTWKKERLIEEIQALENNYACALKRNDNQYNLLQKMNDNQYNLLQKMNEKKEQLKQQLIDEIAELFNCNKIDYFTYSRLFDFVQELAK